jgi:hypothetical protein
MGFNGLYGDSVATLQVARDRLVACSSWPLRFAVYSSVGNLSRRSSCWQWGGTCAFPFRTVTSRNSLLSADFWSITSPSGSGSNVTPRKFSVDCDCGSDRLTTVSGWTRPTSGSTANGYIYTGLSTPAVRRSTFFSRLNATQQRLSSFLGKALGVENHPAPRVINTDEHAGYPPAIVRLKSVGALEENCRHRPVQYLNKC